jgi:hypothetical protein
MVILNSDLWALHHRLSLLKIKVEGFIRFKYACALNRRHCAGIVAAIREAMPVSQEMVQYERERNRLLESTQGQPSPDAVASLRSRHQKGLEGVRAYNEKLAEMLRERASNVPLEKVALSDLPPCLDSETLDDLFPMIEEAVAGDLPATPAEKPR